MRGWAVGIWVALAASGCYLVHERPTFDDGAATLDADVDAADARTDRDGDTGSDTIRTMDSGGPSAFCTQSPDVDGPCNVFRQDCPSASQVCSFQQFGAVRPIVACVSTTTDDCGGRCGAFERCVGAECLPICCEDDPSCAARGGTCAFTDFVGMGICIPLTPCTLVPNDCPAGRSCAMTDNNETYCRAVAHPDDPLPTLDPDTGEVVDGLCGAYPLWNNPIPCPMGSQCMWVGPLGVPEPSVCAHYCRPSHAREDCGSAAFSCLVHPPGLDGLPDPPSLTVAQPRLDLPPGVGVCVPRR